MPLRHLLLLPLLLIQFVAAATSVKAGDAPGKGKPGTAALQQVNQYILQQNLPAAEKVLDAMIVKLSKDKISAGRNRELSKGYSAYGNVLLMQAQFDEALKKYLLSIDYFISAENIDRSANSSSAEAADEHSVAAGIEKAKIYSNIGAVYSMLKNLPKGKEYFLKALAANPAANQDKLKTLSNLAGLYADSGEDSKALHTFNTAIGMARKLQDHPMEAVLLTNLGNYYLKHQAWDKSILASRNSLAVRKNLQQPISVITLNNLGYGLARTGHYTEALSYYQQALPVATAMEKKQLYHNIYQAQKSMGNMTAALTNLEQYTRLTDSLNVLNYTNKVASLTAAYEAVKKERTISVLQKSNTQQKSELRQQRYLMLAGLIILALASVLIYMRVKNYNVKQELEKSQIKRQLLLLQLNPHFIFNALQSVQQFIHQQDQENSMQYLNSFSRLIRLVLENSDRDTISLAEEIEILEHYLHLQQLESGSAFIYQIEVDPKIETEMMEIPVMMLQPYVENAVMHGLRGQPQGRILVRFDLTEHNLEVSIQDSGNGIAELAGPGNTLHRSMAMTILQQRITELNRAKVQVILRVEPRNPADSAYPGTRVNFQFRQSVLISA
jgi:two-component sensor histidine kinase